MNFNNTPIDWHKIHDVVSQADRIMLSTHENPDGDGLGAEGAIYYYLKDCGKDVRIINYSPLSDSYNFLDSDHIFEQYDANHHNDWISNVDLVMVFDIGDYRRLGDISTVINDYNLITMNIDHHPHPDSNPFSHNIVDLSAAATGCMVYDYIKTVSVGPLDKKLLEYIYVAVMTDTGCFRYSNTDEKCHSIVIECLSVGVKTHVIYQNVYENSTKSRMRLMGEFLTNLHYELDGKLAWYEITQDMMQKTHANNDDVEGFSDMVRTIRGVEVAVMIFERKDDGCRINFRSKGRYSVNDIAKSLGGGGHAFAAGAVVLGTLNTVSEKVVETTIKSIEHKINSST